MIRYCFSVGVSLVVCLVIFYGIALQHFQRIDIEDIGKTPRQFYTLYKPKQVEPIKKVQKKPIPKKRKKPIEKPKPKQVKSFSQETVDEVQDVIDEVADIADLDQEVQIIRPIVPRYPDIAQKAGIEATVMLNIIVDEKGNVAFVKVVYCSKPGYGFEKNAIDAAKKLRFQPFLQDGNPIKTKLVYPINFVLVE